MLEKTLQDRISSYYYYYYYSIVFNAMEFIWKQSIHFFQTGPISKNIVTLLAVWGLRFTLMILSQTTFTPAGYCDIWRHSPEHIHLMLMAGSVVLYCISYRNQDALDVCLLWEWSDLIHWHSLQAHMKVCVTRVLRLCHHGSQSIVRIVVNLHGWMDLFTWLQSHESLVLLLHKNSFYWLYIHSHPDI